MSRLIEIEHSQELPPALTLGVGDVLKFWATGGRVESGADVIESLGPYLTSVIGTHGEVVSPAGGPNVILLIARRPGQATINVITGDPWHAAQSRTLQINVNP